VLDVWNSAMDLLSSTIFSSDWWLSKWQVVKDWTSQKWASFMDIWGSVKEQISSTLFSSDWWISKWQAVKDWASGTLNWLEEKGRKLLSPFEAGVEAGREAGQRAAIAHAYGGIISRPHLGLIAEAGPEAIIPLSSRMRPRALELWQQTGELLGVMPELPKLTGQAVITGDKDISENIQYVTYVSETGKRFANVVEMKQYRNLERLKNDIHDNIQQTTEAIETTRRLTNVIDIEQYRNLKTRNNTITENQMQFISATNKIQTVKAYATGGILTKPHIGLVAEAGPEAIIPLTGRMRNRGVALWEEAGRRLGVRTPELALGGAGGSPISVTNYISVSVNSSNADPDEIAEAIAIKLERSYHNMPRN